MFFGVREQFELHSTQTHRELLPRLTCLKAGKAQLTFYAPLKPPGPDYTHTDLLRKPMLSVREICIISKNITNTKVIFQYVKLSESSLMGLSWH